MRRKEVQIADALHQTLRRKVVKRGFITLTQRLQSPTQMLQQQT